MPNTRSAAQPDHQQRKENTALRNRVKKGYEKAQQEVAFKELLQIIGANGGKIPYGAVNKLLKKYKSNGFNAVSWQNHYYRLDKYKKADSNESLVGKSISIAGENSAVVSDLSNPSSNIITEANAESNAKANAESNAEASESIEIIRRGGQKKGSTEAAKTAMSKKRRSDDALCNSVQGGEGEGKGDKVQCSIWNLKKNSNRRSRKGRARN
jgi:hypothetical protein